MIDKEQPATKKVCERKREKRGISKGTYAGQNGKQMLEFEVHGCEGGENNGRTAKVSEEIQPTLRSRTVIKLKRKKAHKKS